MGFLKKMMGMLPGLGGGMPGMPGMPGMGGGGKGGGMPGLPGIPGPDMIKSIFKKKKKKTKDAIKAEETKPNEDLLKKPPAPATSTAYEEFRQYIDPYTAEEKPK